MSEEPVRSKPPGILLEATVFTCGALVMVYEIIGSRIVAPFIGTSTYVWTSLIGVVLAALSIGYWIGGSMADRRPSVRVLAAALFAAGGLVSATILLKDIVLAGIGAMPVILELRTLVAAVVLFAPASVALGFVIPYATKLRLSSLAESGRTVGRLWAFSTVGSIAGTFAAGFLLIPFLGSVRTLYLIAAVLFVLSVLLAGLSFTRLNFALLLLFSLGVGSNEAERYWLARTRNLLDRDTQYSRIRIFDTIDGRTGRPMRVMMNDPDYVQSARYLDGDDLALEYTKFYHLASVYNSGLERSLMIGGAGYSFPQDYLRRYPSATMDVVEIDPHLTSLAKERFELSEDPRLRIIHEDGRVYLNRAPAEYYDAVFIDAFGSLFSVPFQLATAEAVREVHRVLKPGGVVIFNIGTAFSGEGARFLQAEYAAYTAAFADVRVFKVRPEVDEDTVQNAIIVAGKAPLQADSTGDTAEADLLLREYPFRPETATRIPTDDHAPIEYYNSLAQKYGN